MRFFTEKLPFFRRFARFVQMNAHIVKKKFTYFTDLCTQKHKTN